MNILSTFSALACAVLACELLAGCAAPAVTLAGKPAAVSFQAVATLAVGDCDAQTAADFTGLVLQRRAAAARLRDGKLSVAEATQVQARADEARFALGAACAQGTLDDVQLRKARAARSRIDQLLGDANAH